MIRSLPSLKDLEAAVEEEDIIKSAKEKLHLSCTSPSTVSITSVSKKRAMMTTGSHFIQIQEFMNKTGLTGSEAKNHEEHENRMDVDGDFVSEEIPQPRLVKRVQVQ